jgi:hypothetical protein
MAANKDFGVLGSVVESGESRFDAWRNGRWIGKYERSIEHSMRCSGKVAG